ncbi:probable cyclic nucleotide-gated ion channel 10 [Quercus lobata]|uniref:probable cyclic nucleotide-gated ion channel 10 n=1 Tax=Quercus lobata TaxID=97700 RepID=UPI001245F046|nr:probable cyclic nucleotide-gated ion channel 10 [Quercus lobata]
MYMQWTTSKSIKKWEKKRMKMKSSKRQKQQKNLKSWISKHEFHGTTKGNINDYIGQRYEADEDVYVETLIPDLPSELQSDVKRHICLDLLKNLTIIKDSGLAKQEHYCLKSATLSNQCSSMSTTTLLGRETQSMQCS